jgi:hypothetical protein
MATIADLILEWARKDGASDPQIELAEDGRYAQYAFSFSRNDVAYKGWFDVDEQPGLLVFSLYSTEKVQPSRRDAVAQVLTWLNDCKLKVGNFELSAEHGQLKFRVGMPLVADHAAPQMLDTLIESGLTAFEQSMPVIQAVGTAGFSPAAAMMAAEEECADFITTKTVDDATAPPWSRFEGSGVIQAWASQMQDVLALGEAASAESWQLVGPAVLIEHEYPRAALDLAKRIAADCKLPLGIVGADEIANLPDAEDAFERMAPVLLYLEPGDWQQEKEGDKDEEGATARAKVLALLSAFNPAHPVICITALRSANDLPIPLRRRGNFDRRLVLPPVSPELAGDLFLDLVGRECCASSMVDNAAKVGKLLSREFEGPEGRRLAALRMQRMQVSLGRPLEFLDLVEMDANGLSEGDRKDLDGESLRKRVAWHEAGHAAVAILDSEGRDVPEFVSIFPCASYFGVVVSSVNFNFACHNTYTYTDFCHSVRVSLGGRAAEELLFGRAGVSSGCRSDLERCTRLANDAFAFWGFAPDMDADSDNAGNLAIIFGTPSPSEYAHVERLVRTFLAEQYLIVRNQLQCNRGLLDEIYSRLMASAMLDQRDMEAICRGIPTLLAESSLECEAIERVGGS